MFALRIIYLVLVVAGIVASLKSCHPCLYVAFTLQFGDDNGYGDYGTSHTNVVVKSYSAATVMRPDGPRTYQFK